MDVQNGKEAIVPFAIFMQTMREELWDSHEWC